MSTDDRVSTDRVRLGDLREGDIVTGLAREYGPDRTIVATVGSVSGSRADLVSVETLSGVRAPATATLMTNSNGELFIIWPHLQGDTQTFAISSTRRK